MVYIIKKKKIKKERKNHYNYGENIYIGSKESSHQIFINSIQTLHALMDELDDGLKLVTLETGL